MFSISSALNLGVPKSVSTTSSAPSNKASQLPPSSTAITTPLHPSSQDGTSSPNVITSYPNLITPPGGHFHIPTTVLHPSQLPVSTQPTTSTTPKIQSVPKGSGSTINSVRRISQDQDGQGKSASSIHPSQGSSSIKGVKQPVVSHSASSPIGYPSNSVVSQSADLGMSSSRGTNPAVTINLMKPSVSKSTSSSSTVEMPAGTPPGHMTYIASTAHFQPLPSNYVPIGGKTFVKGTKEPVSETLAIRKKSGMYLSSLYDHIHVCIMLCFVAMITANFPLLIMFFKNHVW